MYIDLYIYILYIYYIYIYVSIKIYSFPPFLFLWLGSKAFGSGMIKVKVDCCGMILSSKKSDA